MKPAPGAPAEARCGVEVLKHLTGGSPTNIGARAPQQAGVRNGPQHTALSQRHLHGSSWCVRGQRRLQGNPSFPTLAVRAPGPLPPQVPSPGRECGPRRGLAAHPGAAKAHTGPGAPGTPRSGVLTSWECIEGKTHHPRPSRPGRDHAVGRGPISTLKSRQNTVCGAQGAGRPERGQNPGWRRGRHARSQASGVPAAARAEGGGKTESAAPGGGGGRRWPQNLSGPRWRRPISAPPLLLTTI